MGEFINTFGLLITIISGVFGIWAFFESRNNKALKHPSTILMTLALIVLITFVYVRINPFEGNITSRTQITQVSTPSNNTTPLQGTTITPTPTSTQVPSPTPTPTTSPQDFYTQSTNGSPVFNDPLNNQDNHNWSTDTECSFSNGVYHVHVPSTYFAWCIEQSIDFSNFVYQVQINIVRGDYGGIIFREDYTNAIFYYFYIGQDGSYALFLYQGIKGQQGQLIRSGSSPAINRGLNQPNLIAVIARGNNLYLYVNKQLVTSASDRTVASGLIGVIALPQNNPTEVVCSNAEVWNL